MTTDITNSETPIVNIGPEFGSGEMASQSEEFVNHDIRPEFGLGEKASRNEHDSIKEWAINKPTPFDGDRKKTETFLQECRVYLHINRGVYTTDEDKIIFRSILTRDGDMNFPDIQTFVQLLENYFQLANLGQDAAHQLESAEAGQEDSRGGPY